MATKSTVQKHNPKPRKKRKGENSKSPNKKERIKPMRGQGKKR